MHQNSKVITNMYELDKFFSKKNTVDNITNQDYLQTENYLDVVEAFARITYKSIYIIDYQKKSFEYVSDNPLFLCGLMAEQVKELGYAFYFRNVIDKDLNLLFQINESGFDFYDKLPLDQRKLYTISYDFHIINERGKEILVNHKLTPVFLTSDGKIWKAMCIVALATNQTAGNITISKDNSDIIWKYNQENGSWKPDKKIQLTERELEVLRLHAMGLTINDIAGKLFLSIDTVKFHRRKLFEKIEVQNITDALSYAVNNKLI